MRKRIGRTARIASTALAIALLDPVAVDAANTIPVISFVVLS